MAKAAKKTPRRKTPPKKAAARKSVAKARKPAVETAETTSTRSGRVENGALPPEHRERALLANELHARPFEALEAPARLSTYAMLSGENGGSADREHVNVLCARFGVAPPPGDANYFSADFGHFKLRWERHTEYTSYTFIRDVRGGGGNGGAGSLFEKTASEHLPAEWLATMPGALLMAAHIELMGPDQPDPSLAELAEAFIGESMVSCEVSDQSARLWGDLRLHPDGHERLLVKSRNMGPRKAGRVLQRAVEILSYRTLALLALPMARETGAELAKIDSSLALLTSEMANRTGYSPQERDHALLSRLTQLSAVIEERASATAYRFSAARAYYAVMRERLSELRELRVDGYQTLSEFMERRLAPAMRTCESVAERQADLSRRATRAANLLRTRVDFALERQNHKLLNSMDRRAKLQLRLQQTVEGLSVVAISYYLLGLIFYAAKAARKAGVPLDPTIAAGIALPLAVGAVWFFLHRLKRKLDGDDQDEAPPTPPKKTD